MSYGQHPPHPNYPPNNMNRNVQNQNQRYPQQDHRDMNRFQQPNNFQDPRMFQQQQPSMQFPPSMSANHAGLHSMHNPNVTQSRGQPVVPAREQVQQSRSQPVIPISPIPISPNPAPHSSLSASYSRQTISELVQVPPELSAFCADPQFLQTLLKVKEQTLINFISLNRISENSVESVAIDAPNKESAQLARNLIMTHFNLQKKLIQAESRLEKVQTDLFSAQGEIASGMMVEFSIPSDLVGLIIGKKGARIKQIEQETGVHSIHVNGDSGRIMVSGPDSSSVQRAREKLELHEQSFDLQPHQSEWLYNKSNTFLAEIKQVSELMLARINLSKNTLEVVGVLSSVRSAKLMLPTQLDYIDRQIEIEQSEQSAREQLRAVRQQYGINSYYSKSSKSGDQERGSNLRANSQRENERHPPAKEGHKEQKQQSVGNSRVNNSAHDSLLNLPPAPKTAQQVVPPKAPSAASSKQDSRGSGADIDSIIGGFQNLSTTNANNSKHNGNKNASAAPANNGNNGGAGSQVLVRMTHEEFTAQLSAQAASAQGGGNNQKKSNNKQEKAKQPQQQQQDRVRDSRDSNKQQTQSALSRTVSEVEAKSAKKNPAQQQPMVVLSSTGLQVSAPVEESGSRKRNNRNKNAAAEETAPQQAKSSKQQVTYVPKTTAADLKKAGVAIDKTTPMLLQINQGLQTSPVAKTAPASKNSVVEGEGAPKRGRNNRRDKNNVTTAGNVGVNSDASAALLRSVTTDGDKVAADFDKLKPEDSAQSSGPAPARKNNRRGNKSASAEGSDAATASVDVPVVPAAVEAPKRAKRASGASAVIKEKEVSAGSTPASETNSSSASVPESKVPAAAQKKVVAEKSVASSDSDAKPAAVALVELKPVGSAPVEHRSSASFPQVTAPATSSTA